MDKKGERLTWNTLIDIVLVAMAILALTSLLWGLIEIFTGDTEEERASINNLENIAEELKNMNDGSQETVVFIKKGMFIVGFSHGQEKVSAMCALDANIPRPRECGEGACICLCNEDDHCTSFSRCESGFKKKYEFSGGGGCAIPYIKGDDEPQVIHLKKTDSSIHICKEKC